MRTNVSVIVAAGLLCLLIGFSIGLFVGLQRKPVGPELIAPNDGAGPKEKSAAVVSLRLSEYANLSLLRVVNCEKTFAGETPITNVQYRIAVDAGAVPAPVLPEKFKTMDWIHVRWTGGNYPEGQDEYAVLFVNEEEAELYCLWLEKRFPDYHFRLPGTCEQDQIKPELAGMHSPTLFSVYHPRAAKNGGPLLVSKAGFWHAPRTVELGNLNEDDEDLGLFRKFGPDYIHRPEYRQRRFHTIAGGSLGDLHFPWRPHTFRVVAVAKQ